MPEFYATPDGPGAAARRAAEAALATDQVSRPGVPVRFLGAVAVPQEETCFWLYQAPSASAVRAAMTSARLRPDRITPVGLHRPAPWASPRFSWPRTRQAPSL